MSSRYGSNEPPTHGKVLLHTSAGDVDVELWPKEAPLACRNFVQLCLERYYEGVVFHRVIKDFMAQTGDPTGTGEGGASVFGKPFKDEVHQRLRFTHAGQLAMANQGDSPNSNESQFFVTLGACEWLNKKHTIFGKVTGATIYNALKLNEVEVDDGDRPVDPMPTILSAEVLLNPFDDIVPRPSRFDELEAKERKRAAKAAKRKRKERKHLDKKDLRLVSMGGDDEDDEEDEVVNVSLAKLHQPKRKKAKKEKVVEKEEVRDLDDKDRKEEHKEKTEEAEEEEEEEEEDVDEERRQEDKRTDEKKKTTKTKTKTKTKKKGKKSKKSKKAKKHKEEEVAEEEQDEFKRLREALRPKEEAAESSEPAALSALEQRRAKYLVGKSKKPIDTLKVLEAFNKTLKRPASLPPPP